MRRYIRQRQPGGCYFFTLVTYDRNPTLATLNNVEKLRSAIAEVRKRMPFHIDAMAIMPDHLHCIWRLPENDDNYPVRWTQIKRRFSMSLSPVEVISGSRTMKRERAIWQRRYWEHLIRDEEDWRRHMDYIHYNPVKHGLVARVHDWPYSSFAHCVAKGWYETNWGENVPTQIQTMELD